MVLTLDPDHVNAAYARGACENKRGNFDKAIEDYHLALDKDKERDTGLRPKSPLADRSSEKQPLDAFERAEELHNSGYDARQRGDY